MCGQSPGVCCSGVETIFRVCQEREMWRMSDKSGHGLRVVRTQHGVAGQANMETGRLKIFLFSLNHEIIL